MLAGIQHPLFPCLGNEASGSGPEVAIPQNAKPNAPVTHLFFTLLWEVYQA